MKALDPTLQYLTPAQTVCNYVDLLFRNASFLLGEGDANGTWLRFVPIITPQGPNNETGPSSAPASGGGPDPSNSSRNYLHDNPYPNTAGPGQTRECEAGNEKYRPGKTVIGNLPGGKGTVRTAEGREDFGEVMEAGPAQPARRSVVRRGSRAGSTRCAPE